MYEAGSFADYSGAHIDIGTKENTGGDFLRSALIPEGSSIRWAKLFITAIKGYAFYNS